MMSFIPSQVVIDLVPDYMIAPLDLEELRSFVRGLQSELAEFAHPQAGQNL
ncbi:MAG TPA: hypothetical protein VFJ58_13100 [Armatimonadota bacterium]|nr:hypothetical protein [Armatimonadota bacterium]